MRHKVCFSYRCSTTHKPLHRKGLLTVCLLLLAESITLSNAVSSSSSWSSHRQNQNNDAGGHHRTNTADNYEDDDRQNKTPLDDDNLDPSSACGPRSTAHECSTTTTTTTSPPFRPSRNRRTRTCTKTMHECCHRTCPSCFLPDLRGGATTPTTTLLSSAAETLTSTPPPPLEGTTPFDLPLNAWKVIFQIFLTTLNVVCWLVPLRAEKWSENELGLSIANAFSGGVFLSLAFGHLIPECVHGFEGYNESLPFMIVLGGYLLIFFVEKVAFDTSGLIEGGGGGGGESEGTTGKEVAKMTEEQQQQQPVGGLNNGRSAVILLGALAVHSILEMTALGLADSFGDTALLSASIALHQPAESIALLVAFLKSGMPKPQIAKYLSVFSTMGPIGVAIGMFVNEFAAPIVDSIMLATVAGTFIYVGATEVIPEEWESQEHKYKKFFALVGGIVSIFGITQYAMNLEAQTR